MTYANATYYDCLDSEDYAHETPEEAIEYLLDEEMTPNCDVEKVIRDKGPIEVKAYNRDEVTPEWVNNLALRLAELAEEEWSEEYGSPNGDGFDGDAFGHLAEKIYDMLTEIIPQQPVWRCSECGKRTYSVEEVLKLMRDRHPDWFEKTLPRIKDAIRNEKIEGLSPELSKHVKDVMQDHSRDFEILTKK